MYRRSFATIIASGAIGLATLAASPNLHAQARLAESNPLKHSTASLLNALGSYRTVRWESAATVLRCSPAPLTERPGIQAEFSRPPIVPLEEAFADAQDVKRAMSYRARAIAMENR